MDEHIDSGTSTMGHGDSSHVRRLTRRTDHKVVAGVCAGLGDYFSVDPVLFRIGFVLLAVLGGAGVLVYLLAWLVMPASRGDGTATAPTEPIAAGAIRRFRDLPGWVGVGLLILGGAILADEVGLRRPGIVWGVALIALGVLLFLRDADHDGDGDPGRGGGSVTTATDDDGGGDTSAPPPAPSSSALGAGADTTKVAVPEASASWRNRWPLRPRQEAIPRRVRPRRERSSLGWITFGVTLLALGLAAVLHDAGAITLRPVQFPALALAAIGAGLVAGAWWGRSRGLIVLGILVVPLVLAASLIDVPLRGGFGDRAIRPAAAAEVRSEYRLVGGRMVLDLSGVPFTGQVTIQVSVVAGQLIVVVPRGLPVEVHARAGAGEVNLFGQHFDGFKVDVRRTYQTEATSALLVIDAAASFGQVEVKR